ncbi:MAG: NTP transferase domain-containing protein [Candidatus Kerfeldbacteria bacterium]|nr:NTP transferase domain-containing protein [Candidatus Kerfeldbacteria bacterium]
MVSRVVIMAAGKGTRMKHLTADRPKHLLPVSGRPFIEYLLERLQAAGFQELIVVVGYHAAAFREWARTAPFRVTLVHQSMGADDPYGTAIPVLTAKGATRGEPFVVVGGDNLYSVRDLKKFIRDDGWNYAGGLHSNHPERYGVFVPRPDGTLERIVEKPSEFVGDVINAQLYAFRPEVFEALDTIGQSPRGEYELTDAVTILAGQHQVKIVTLEDFWIDFGRPEDIPRLEAMLGRGNGQVGE